MEETLFCRVGRIDYARAWAWQEALREQCRAGVLGDVVLLVEHPPTYTGGRATLPEHLLKEDLDVVPIDRGGSVTFHGPGQLVAYPIVDLRARGRDVHQYLRDLEAVLIATLAAYGLIGVARPGLTGAWVDDRKVASIGIHVRHWITAHGLALNIATDLDYFAAIRPCGLGSGEMTTMNALLGRVLDPIEVEAELLAAYGEIFAVELVEVGREALAVRADAPI
ncbi:MAG: lipoyl(octanoyl) transferase LipB [Candidatus Latescibacteria bacterium]|jgi:lipoate-protein ligase B|nr:lipoyl(octanoyl) transferase LipB [Candidatus Latescibacterota bacterium]